MNFSVGGGSWGFLGFWIVLAAVGIGVVLVTIFFRKTVEGDDDEPPASRAEHDDLV